MGCLYIVSTPIGNLSDISLRALEILQQVDWIVAEDTRHTHHLLTHFGIKKRAISFHQHNEHERISKIIALLTDGQTVALVSDAGTPLISDPGYPLVIAAQEKKIPVVPVPGACAAIAALSASGLPSTEFLFVGFVPPKGEKRKKRLTALAHETRTVIFYESVHRIIDLLEHMLPLFGSSRMACLARELTKKYETIYRDSLQAVYDFIKADPAQQKGEIVLVVEGHTAEITDSFEACQRILKILLAEQLSVTQSVRITQQLTDISRKKIYETALHISQGNF